MGPSVRTSCSPALAVRLLNAHAGAERLVAAWPSVATGVSRT
jgi:hypothetical protein